jgi:hypothetical protein
MFHYQVQSYEQVAAQTPGQTGIGERYEDVEASRAEIRRLYDELAETVRRELGPAPSRPTRARAFVRRLVPTKASPPA